MNKCRTIDEIKQIPVSYTVRTAAGTDEYVRVSTKERDHLLAIARAAERGDEYDFQQALINAREAGMFNKEENHG